MSIREAIVAVLAAAGVKPEQLVGERTAFDVLEGYVQRALDEIAGEE